MTCGYSLMASLESRMLIYYVGYLIVDMGGVHGPTTTSVSMAAVAQKAPGMQKGKTCNLDIFFAQRHSPGELDAIL